MPNFRIEAAITADMHAVTYIDAETEEQARALGKEFFDSGNADWQYDGESADSWMYLTVTDRDAS